MSSVSKPASMDLAFLISTISLLMHRRESAFGNPLDSLDSAGEFKKNHVKMQIVY